jgi:hypothetical protein
MTEQLRDDAGKVQVHYILSNAVALHRCDAYWDRAIARLSKHPLLHFSEWLAGDDYHALIAAFVSTMVRMDPSAEYNMEGVLGFLGTADVAVAELTNAYINGNTKYKRGNFKLGADVCKYADSAGRHLLKWATGEDFPGDSPVLHLGHAAWNIWQILDQPVERDNRLRG